MTQYDLLVLGGGTGNNVASAAAKAGMKTALIERDKLGGTCLNRGCNPSKMLIKRADIVSTIDEADAFGITATVDSIDHEAIVNDVWDTLNPIEDSMRDTKQAQENLTLYEQTGTFTDTHSITLDDGTILNGDKIVIATGSSPVVPSSITGLDSVDYMTSYDLMQRTSLPDSVTVLGGGYIAAELGYYMDAMGVDVTLVEMQDTLLPREDADISNAFTELAADRHTVKTNHTVQEVEETDDGVRITATTETGTTQIIADDILVALGRKPNTAELGLEHTAVTVDDRGFIVTDETLQTTADSIWAQGDVADNWMFKHAADYETEVVIDNVCNDADRQTDYTGMPHAVFTHPQVAGVGKTQQALDDEETEYVIGKHEYTNTAMGRAQKSTDGFVKVLADKELGTILGVHIIGKDASSLIHEATLSMRNNLTVNDVAKTVYVHPSLSKVVRAAFQDAADEVDLQTD